jgi:hypothetical protein
MLSFAITEFYEVRDEFIAVSSPLATVVPLIKTLALGLTSVAPSIKGEVGSV